MVTVYVPTTLVVKLDTLPGFDAPPGTDHAYVYEPAGFGVAVIVALLPLHTLGLLTVTVGLVFTVTVPLELDVQLLPFVMVTV